MHNFISSGFVTLGRGHLKGKVRPHYQFFYSHFTVQNNKSSVHSRSRRVMLSLSLPNVRV